MSRIPIQNIYYLLCYAWNKLEERDIVNISSIESTSLMDLFTRVIISGLNHLFKRGLDRDYVDYSEDTRTIRGKINWTPTIKRNLIINSKIHCEFDELDYNILHNQIIKATLKLLIHTDSIDSDLRDSAIGFYRRFQDVDDIRLSSWIFPRVQLHQNNYFYEFLLNICFLVYESLLASEKVGMFKFREFIQDERKMSTVFEDFVRNFYRIEFPAYRVRSEVITWNLEAQDDVSRDMLPKMNTDISIESTNSKVVIDTKFYKEALSTNYDKQKIHSAHLYQITALYEKFESQGRH